MLEPRTATVMAEAFEEATRNFASRSDVEVLGRELRTEAALLRSEVALSKHEVRGEVAALRAEISEKLRAQTFSMIAAMAAIVGVAVAVLKLTG